MTPSGDPGRAWRRDSLVVALAPSVSGRAGTRDQLPLERLTGRGWRQDYPRGLAFSFATRMSAASLALKEGESCSWEVTSGVAPSAASSRPGGRERGRRQGYGLSPSLQMLKKVYLIVRDLRRVQALRPFIFGARALDIIVLQPGPSKATPAWEWGR